MAAEMIPCTACGKQINRTQGSCIYCGARHRTHGYRRKSTAIVLALLFGNFGAHRFYMRSWWGLLYPFFGGLFVLVALGEGIRYAFMSREQWDEKYNEGIPELPATRPRLGLAVASLLGIGFWSAVTFQVMERMERARATVAEQARQAEQQRQADLAVDVDLAVAGTWRTVRITEGVPYPCSTLTLEFARGELRVHAGDYQGVKRYTIERRSGGDSIIVPKHASDNGKSDCRGQTAQLANAEWDRELLFDGRAAPQAISHCFADRGCIFLHKVAATEAAAQD